MSSKVYTHSHRPHNPNPYPYPYQPQNRTFSTPTPAPQSHSNKQQTAPRSHSHYYYSPSSSSTTTSTTSTTTSTPTALPSFSLQRPSHAYSTTLPPITHFKPGSDLRHSRPHSTSSRKNGQRHCSSPHLSTIHLSTPRIVSPVSRASDLARYAMTKDEKPIIDAHGDARSRSPAGSEDRSPRLTLAPLSASPHRSTPSLSIDVELSRKRKTGDREEGYSPGTPHSHASSSGLSQYVVTPQTVPADHPHKRRGSIIEHLLLSEKDHNAGQKGGDLPWYRPRSPYDSMNYPIPAPITVFPVQYAWNNTGAAPVNPPANGAAPNAPTTGNGINVDTALSSIRSSAGQQNNGDAAVAPELKFPDDTLASAAASPARDGSDQAESSTAALAAIAASADLLAPPDDDLSGKKDQPFSRSPELRISHKIAERRRRKEMKDLFDELREELPADRGMKASKWEILSKAIDYIRLMKSQQQEMHREIEHSRRELDIARGGSGAYPPTYPSYNIPTTYPPATPYTSANATAAVAAAAAAMSQQGTVANHVQVPGQTQPQAQVPIQAAAPPAPQVDVPRPQ